MDALHKSHGVLVGVLALVGFAVGCGGGDRLEPPTQTMTRKEGDNQNVIVGTAVAVAPSVTVADADGNPVAGIAVTFQVTSGGGSVTPTTPINTDAQGSAAVTSWTLGTTPGPNTLTASAAGVAGSPVVFTATGLAGGVIRGTITVSNDLLSAKAPDRGRGSRAFQISTGQRAKRQQTLASNELIVRFRPGYVGASARLGSTVMMQSTAGAVAAKIRAGISPHLAARVITLMGISPAVLAARVRVERPADIDRIAAALRADPVIATVERNSIVRLAGADEPRATGGAGPLRVSSNDPLSPLQAWNHQMIDLPESWSLTTGSASVLVAVISDGIRFDHPDIGANLTSDGYDFVSTISTGVVPGLCSGGPVDFSGDGDGYDNDPTVPTEYLWNGECLEGPLEVGSLGLAHAGTIGAIGNNGIGLSGVNWTVRVRPIRAFGVYGLGFTYDIVQAILYAAGLPADDGAGGVVQAAEAARIICLNFGSFQDDPIQRDAIVAAANSGALLIASAGSYGDSEPVYPSVYPEVLAVSAVGPNRELASYSSFGSMIDIAAPGGDFADGDFSFGVATTFWNFVTGEPIYAFGGGTGTAASHVAGVAALLLAQDPALTAPALKSRLTQYAVDAGSPGQDDQYGAGIVNARNSLTQNFAPARQLHTRLYDALTGAAVQTAAVATDGSYSFAAAPGSYLVFAGQDENADGLTGLPGRRWGAFGSSAKPSTIEVTVGGSHQASFSVGFPSEREPNETSSQADALPVGGYLSGVVSSPNGGDIDGFRVLIPEAGEYTFETSGIDGACGFALQENTTLELYAQDETALARSEDIDAAAEKYCSRISTTLQPGTYYLRLHGLRGPNDRDGRGGLYQIQARSGP